MTNNAKDLQQIEDSREVNDARLIIAKDLTRLNKMLTDKKIKGETQCFIKANGAMTIYTSAPGRCFNGPHGKDNYFFATSTNWDEAYNTAMDIIKNADGDLSVQCQPWFDMKVYDDIKKQPDRNKG